MSVITDQKELVSVFLTLAAIHGGRDMNDHFELAQMPDLSAPAWPADRLVFLNDVFFCAGDLIRLLQHDKSDMACGMDFVAWKSPPSTNDIQPYGPYGPPLSVYASSVPKHLPAKPLQKAVALQLLSTRVPKSPLSAYDTVLGLHLGSHLTSP